MKVRFATPCLTHHVAAEFCLAALGTERLLTKAGIDHDWYQRPGDPFIGKVRSDMVGDFLESADTDLFFLDDDVSWEPEKALKFILSDVDVLAGVYPQRQDELNWPCVLEANDGALVERDGLVKALAAPTGFMRIKRRVLEKLWPLAPPYRTQEADGTERHRRAVFHCGPTEDGRWWGEDYVFCNAVNANGFEVWIDPSVSFWHRGTKRWGGRMAESLDVFRERASTSVPTESEAA